MSRWPITFAAALIGLTFALLSPGAALAHGDEDEALAETPPRALVQQALGLLSQGEEPVDAAERLEAALESPDSAGVDPAAIRDALAAIERGDDAEAITHVNEALAPAAAPAEEEPPRQPGAQKGAEAASPSSEEALSHAEEFEPERGAAEWAGFGAGLVAIAIGAVLLGGGRRRAAV